MPVDREGGSPPYITNPVSGNKHSQTRSLRIMARNQGWDPDAIIDLPTGKKVGSMTEWDIDPDVLKRRSVGSLPGEIPAVQANWPDDRPSLEAGTVKFSYPDTDRENTARRTDDADPFAGMA